MRLGHCPNAVGEPFGLRSRILPAEPASPYRSRERVRVRAWRQPNEDAPSVDVAFARVHAAIINPQVRGFLRLLDEIQRRNDEVAKVEKLVVWPALP